MTTLASLKRDVFVVGKAITMTRLAWKVDGEWKEAGGRLIGVPRTVTKVQSNGVYINDSFLSFKSGAEWVLNGDTLTCNEHDTILEYKIG